MISTSLQVLPDLSPRLNSYLGIPLREDSAYTDAKGRDKNRLRRRTEKALENIQEILRKVLEPEEAVFYCARAQMMPSGVEQLVLGWVGQYTGYGLLVLTNRRLLYFTVARNGSWRKSLRMARWGDITQAKVSGLLGAKLKMKYQSGNSETYWKIRGDDGKRIKQLVALFQGSGAGETSPAQGMISSCPGCLKPLTPGVYECSQCHLRFKDEKTLTRRALLIPGGAYFYTGFTGLGVISLLGEGLETFVSLFGIVEAFVDKEPSLLAVAGFFCRDLVLPQIHRHTAHPAICAGIHSAGQLRIFREIHCLGTRSIGSHKPTKIDLPCRPCGDVL